MNNDHKVVFLNGEPVFKNTANQCQIDDVYIDMTGWWNSDDLSGKGTYPYRIKFTDSKNTVREMACTGCKSGGMHTLLTTAKDKYNLVLRDRTKVHILTPTEYVTTKNLPFGGMSVCTIQALRKYGMKALDFEVTSKYNVEARLETVLDEVVHQEVTSYRPIIRRDAKFPNSVLNYIVEDSDARIESITDMYLP